MNVFKEIYNSVFPLKVPQISQIEIRTCIFALVSKATPISADGVKTDLKLIECFFDHINGDQEGGCVHFSCSGLSSSFSFDRVIAQSCQTDSNMRASFAWIECNNAISLIDLSIDQTPSSMPNAFYSVYVQSTKLTFMGGNATRSKSQSDFFYFLPTISSTSSFVHFYSNTINQHVVVVFQSGSNKMNCATFMNNVMNNVYNFDYAGIVYVYKCNLELADSYFSGGVKGNYVSEGSGSITVKNSMLDVNSFFGNVKTFAIANSGTRPKTRIVKPIKIEKVSFEDKCKVLKSMIVLIL